MFKKTRWYHVLGFIALMVILVACSIGVTLIYIFGIPAHFPGAATANSEAVAKTETVVSTPVPDEVQKPDQPTQPSTEFFQSPVLTTETFNKESAWMIAEPGVILNDTAAWVIPSTDETYFANVPEGGFTYFSMGQGNISVDGVTLHLPGAKGLNYLVLIRGRIDDTIVDSDLNLTVEVTDFVPGHAIWSIMPPGAYVSKDWFRQQLVTSTTTGGTNCGATGCSRVIVVLFDTDSHHQDRFEVQADDLDNWVPIGNQ